VALVRCCGAAGDPARDRRRATLASDGGWNGGALRYTARWRLVVFAADYRALTAMGGL